MFNMKALAFLIVIGSIPVAYSAPLNGEVSEEGQPRIPRDNGNLSGEMPAVAPDRRYGSVQSQGSNQSEPLVGNLADFASPQRPTPQRSPIMAGAQNQLSALGVAFKFSSGKVTSVDPGSDVYGQIFEGDRIIAYDGMSPVDSYRSGSNFGSAGSVVQLTFEHGGLVRTLPCRRKPVSEFSPAFQAELNWGALRR
jgi:hypothetical protein